MIVRQLELRVVDGRSVLVFQDGPPPPPPGGLAWRRLGAVLGGVRSCVYLLVLLLPR